MQRWIFSYGLHGVEHMHLCSIIAVTDSNDINPATDTQPHTIHNLMCCIMNESNPYYLDILLLLNSGVYSTKINAKRLPYAMHPQQWAELPSTCIQYYYYYPLQPTLPITAYLYLHLHLHAIHLNLPCVPAIDSQLSAETEFYWDINRHHKA